MKFRMLAVFRGKTRPLFFQRLGLTEEITYLLNIIVELSKPEAAIGF